MHVYNSFPFGLESLLYMEASLELGIITIATYIHLILHVEAKKVVLVVGMELDNILVAISSTMSSLPTNSS